MAAGLPSVRRDFETVELGATVAKKPDAVRRASDNQLNSRVASAPGTLDAHLSSPTRALCLRYQREDETRSLCSPHPINVSEQFHFNWRGPAAAGGSASPASTRRAPRAAATVGQIHPRPLVAETLNKPSADPPESASSSISTISLAIVSV